MLVSCLFEGEVGLIIFFEWEVFLVMRVMLYGICMLNECYLYICMFLGGY